MKRILKLSAVVLVALASSLLLKAELPGVPVNTWVTVGDLGIIPDGAASASLPDGRLVVAGGRGADGVVSSDIRMFDPATSSWSTSGQLVMARERLAAATLPDGRVVFAGGATDQGLTSDVEIFNPTTGLSAHAGNLTSARADHAAAALKSGEVLIVGGSEGGAPLAMAEFFVPESGASRPLGASMRAPRAKATATTLLDGHVLVAVSNREDR